MDGVPVSGVVEGIVDEVIVRVLLDHAGRVPGTIYVQRGKPRLLERLAGFNAAARFRPWLVLVDLNGDEPCAPDFVTRVLPKPSTQMMFRVAVRQAESWLMGDAERLASYLRVSGAHVPSEPQGEADAKQTMVNIARKSRDRHVQADMVPTPASGRKTGPNYAGRLIDFATQCWRPDIAAERVDSLNRCLRQLAAPPPGY
jgi:hypothetical protein